MSSASTTLVPCVAARRLTAANAWPTGVSTEIRDVERNLGSPWTSTPMALTPIRPPLEARSARAIARAAVTSRPV